jgi:adenosylmethionine-8-amino-7-oxononanoate aminotransferase
MGTPSGKVFPRPLQGSLPLAARAEGLWIYDDQGRRYLDASAGNGVVNLGHGRPEIASAVHDQIMACDYAHPALFGNAPVEDLAAALARHAPPELSRFYFQTSGSEAVETAIKLARQIHLDNGRPQRARLIALWQSDHGHTLGALAASGRASLRAPYAPLLGEVHHIPPPYCLRCAWGLKRPSCDLRCAEALEQAIQNLGQDTVSAFLAETACGAALAAVVPPRGYWPRIRQICDHYQVLLIQDEVTCGLGRTGRWLASEHYGVTPDILTLGKGLGGGALALSAVGTLERHFAAIRDGGGVFPHGGAFSHHAVAAAAGLAALGIMEQEGLVERVAEMGQFLGRLLGATLADHPHVAQVRGLGFLWGVELVADKATLAPYPRAQRMGQRLWRALLDQGLITGLSTGLAGSDGDALVVSPPFTAGDQDLEYIVDVLTKVVGEVLGA